MAGEIFVSGPTLGLGYLNRPELTGKRFPPRPASMSPLPKLIHSGQDAGTPTLYSRLYDTGDWGRLLSDGSLEILGRHDCALRRFDPVATGPCGPTPPAMLPRPL